MGLLDRVKNVVRPRPGQGQNKGQSSQGIRPPYPNFNWEDCIVALQRNPQISDKDFASVMGWTSGENAPAVSIYKERALQELNRRQLTVVPSPNTQGPNTGPLPTFTGSGNSDTSLVSYKPEELMLQVHHALSTVHFGMSKPAKFKEMVAEVWSIIGPIVLLLGTAGEVFFFIWSQTNKDAAWWVAMSVLATVVVLEATFMVVSYKAETIRNRAESRPNGMTALDQTKISRYRSTWAFLAFGVGSGQVAFMILAMSAKSSNLVWLVVFAMVRTVMTLASDFYVAFIHEEKPTEASEVIRSNELRASATSKMLHQRTEETSIINNGILEVRRVTAEAAIKEDNLKTELEMSKMENQARIEGMRSQQENNTLMLRMGASTMRALFDPEMPVEQKEAQLKMLTMLMRGMKELPPGHTTIEEED